MTTFVPTLFLAFFVALFMAFNARADMTAITVEASVRGFDAKTVTLQVNKKRVVVPRELVLKTQLHNGEAVRVTFQGANIQYLFKAPNVEAKVDSSARKPASEKPSR
jgi:hypothetical protein